MQRLLPTTVFILLLLPSCDSVRGPDDSHVPWETAAPGAEGLNAAALDALRQRLEKRQTRAFVVVRNGRIAYEWYAPGVDRSTRLPTASLAKSLAGGMALLIALSDGAMTLDDRAAAFIPAWRQDTIRSRVTIRHLAAHASGIPHGKIDDRVVESPWAREFWARDPNPIAAVVQDAPITVEPGSAYAYSGPAFAALGYAISAALSAEESADIRTILARRIMSALDIPESAWSIGYGQVFHVDGLPVNPLWGGGEYTARAVARVGELMLRHGQWEGEALLDSAWVERVVEYGGTPLPESRRTGHPAPSATWWTNANEAWPTVPCDAFIGAGAGHRILAVIPSLDLVAVRLGRTMTDADWAEPGFWSAVESELLQPLADAVVGRDDARTADCGRDA